MFVTADEWRLFEARIVCILKTPKNAKNLSESRFLKNFVTLLIQVKA